MENLSCSAIIILSVLFAEPNAKLALLYQWLYRKHHVLKLMHSRSRLVHAFGHGGCFKRFVSGVGRAETFGLATLSRERVGADPKCEYHYTPPSLAMSGGRGGQYGAVQARQAVRMSSR